MNLHKISVRYFLEDNRKQAMVNLMAEEGVILVSYRSRNSGEQENDILLPLYKDEIDVFKVLDLSEMSFLSDTDDQELPVPHFFATY